MITKKLFIFKSVYSEKSNYLTALCVSKDTELFQTEGQFVGNGIVECINTLLGALITFYLQYMNINWQKYGEFIFFFSSILVGSFLYGMTIVKNIFIVYGFYLLSDIVYHMLIAAASNLIASQLTSSSYSFIFGFFAIFATISRYKEEPTPEYIEKTSTGLPGWILLFLLIIAFAGGALFYMIRTDKLDTPHIDIRSIRFINPDRFTRRTDSESSLMNPVYRSTTDFH